MRALDLLILFLIIFLSIYGDSSILAAEQEKGDTEKAPVSKSKMMADAFQKQEDFKVAISLCDKDKIPLNTCLKNYFNSKNYDYKTLTEMAKELNYNSPDKMKADSSLAYETLKDYLSAELEKAMRGEKKSESVSSQKMTDQLTYIKLYRSQLGKNVLLELSQFCLENLPLPTSENLDGDYSAKKSSDITADMKTKTTTLTAEHYQSCINCVDYFCHETDSKWREEKDKHEEARKKVAACDELSKLYTEDQKDNIRKNACTLIPRIRNYRSIISKTNKILENFSESNNIKATGYAAKGTAGYSDLYDERKLDDLTIITSNELVNESKLGDTLSAAADDFEKRCLQAKEIEYCKKVIEIDQNGKGLEELKKEFDTNTQLMVAKIQSTGADSNGVGNAGLKEYLKEVQGKTDAEVEEILQKSNTEIQAIKQDYVARYEKEREEIKKKLSEQISSKTLVDLNSDSSKLEDAMEELKDTKDRLQRLFHYNNVVTSYLQRSASDSKNEGDYYYDPTALQREIADSAYANDEAYFKNFKAAAGDALDNKLNKRSPAQNDDKVRAIDESQLDQILGNRYKDE